MTTDKTFSFLLGLKVRIVATEEYTNQLPPAEGFFAGIQLFEGAPCYTLTDSEHNNLQGAYSVSSHTVEEIE